MATGDITSKPGVGTYSYPSAGQARPHAVSSIAGTVRGVVNPSFSYDADGNTLTGPGMTAGYTSYDMPSSIVTPGQPPGPGPYWASFTWGGASWASSGASFVNLVYNSEHQRMEMSTATAATFYFNDPTSGAAAEYYVPAGGAAQWRDYVMADGRMIAERTAVIGGATTWQYFVADHLGSIAVTTDGSGNVSERMIYDPWGLQLSPSGADLCGVGTPTTRGFTGEEQMPLNCLVNLNARVYDPVLGRFLTGDPVISSVYDQQALNRYTYVHNNPLSYTDTNGECGGWCIVADIFVPGFLLAELLKPVLERAPILGDLFIIADGIYCGPFCAAETAAVISGVETGKVGKALEAFALTFAEAEAFDAVGDNLQGLKAVNQAGMLSDTDYNATAFIEHGLVGGTFSAIRGQGFGSGFLSAGVSELATPYIADPRSDLALGAAESAVVGGVSSVIGGGKFDNGAVTGAFGYLFNAGNHISNAQDCHGNFACEKAVFDAGSNQAFKDDWWLAIPALAPAAVVVGLEASAGILFGEADTLIGTTFGKLGTVVADPGIEISGYTPHALQQAAARDVSIDVIQQTIDSPLVVLEQANGSKYLYINQQAAVAIGSDGEVITTYPRSMFDQDVMKVLKAAGK